MMGRSFTARFEDRDWSSDEVGQIGIRPTNPCFMWTHVDDQRKGMATSEVSSRESGVEVN